MIAQTAVGGVGAAAAASLHRLKRRYVHGPGVDEPLAWYEGTTLTDKRFLHADERGSIIAVSNSAGTSIATNKYDEYGIPAATNVGRFGYTGQTWLPEVGMWYYKARMYSPTLGRFLQTDLMGYQYGMNWYGYVGADPVNFVDPSGMITQVSGGKVYRFLCVVVGDEPASCGWVETGFSWERLDERLSGMRYEIVASSQRKPDCIRQSAGPVVFAGVAFDAVTGLGGGVSWQHFNIPSTGDSGWAVSTSKSAGVGFFAGATGGAYSSIGSYLGTSYGVSVATPISRLSAGGSINSTGGGISPSFGAGLGSYASVSNTRP
jgi:RHS repeat-associated protein